MCGITGSLSHDPNVDVAGEIVESLSLLQHRGQDAAGVVTCGYKGRFYQVKANGMVRDIFDESSVSNLLGGMGIGHGAFSILRFSIILFFEGRLIGFVELVSEISDCWKLESCRGAAFLRQLALWNLPCTCTSVVHVDSGSFRVHD